MSLNSVIILWWYGNCEDYISIATIHPKQGCIMLKIFDTIIVKILENFLFNLKFIQSVSIISDILVGLMPDDVSKA